MQFLKIYSDVFSGEESAPRGQLIREVEDYMFTLPPRDRFTSYTARNFNLDYAKFEMLWYLTGNPFNDSITKSATMWSHLRQPDGRWHSNYGQYWFGAQRGFNWVCSQLQIDKDSRQAVIPMLNRDHLYVGNNDVVCTYGVSFRIRKNLLNMSVNMRSQDVVWGLTNDVFCFSILHEMVFAYLQETAYYDLRMGEYVHKVDSLHVYEHHFEMLDNILTDGVMGYYEVQCPMIAGRSEVQAMIKIPQEKGIEDNNHILQDTENMFLRWLYTNKYSRQT